MVGTRKASGSPGRSVQQSAEDKPLLPDNRKNNLAEADVYSFDDETKLPDPVLIGKNVGVNYDTNEKRSYVASIFFPCGPKKKESRGRSFKLGSHSSSQKHRRAPSYRRLCAGKLAVMCVGESIDLDLAERHYKSSGFVTSIKNDVLHVTNVKSYRSGYTPTEQYRREFLTSILEHSVPLSSKIQERFDFYIFQFGSVVWWGLDMESYRSVVEKLFFYGGQDEPQSVFTKSSFISKLQETLLKRNPPPFVRRIAKNAQLKHRNTIVQERYPQGVIEKLFPLWLNFSFGNSNGDSSCSGPVLELSDEMFLHGLQRDHILLQSELPAHKEAISHALAQSAKLDVLEPMVDELLGLSRPLPKQLSSNGHARITANAVNMAKGKLFLCRMNLRDLLDEPEYFWDFPWFYRYYGILRADYSIEQRVVFLEEQLSAVQEILDMLGDQFAADHNMRLEWIVIWLIIAAVVIAGIELYTQVMRLGAHK